MSAVGEPMKITTSMNDSFVGLEDIRKALPPGLLDVRVAGPPGLAEFFECAPPGVLSREHLLAVQNERLLMQNALLSQQAQVAMQSLAYQHALSPYPSVYPHCGVYPHHGSVSSSASTASGDVVSDAGASEETSYTTLIIKKVPKAFTRDMLLNLLERNGFRAKYDFVYIPIDFEKCLGTGCAFINFVDTESAERFQDQFQGFRSWGVRCSGTKVAEVGWSQACQGKPAHIERYRDSPVMHPSVPDEYKPVVLKDGVRMLFPPPTRMPKAPRLQGSIC